MTWLYPAAFVMNALVLLRVVMVIDRALAAFDRRVTRIETDRTGRDNLTQRPQ